jgi:hypothetical protein
MNKNFLTAKMGAHLIAAKVMQTGRDADVVAVSYGQWRVQTHNSLGDRVTIKPRTMVKGPTWQDKINVPDDDTTLWVMLDLTAAEPQFYVAPTQWMATFIRDLHQQYLDEEDPTTGKRKGHRAHNDDSNHTAWRPEQVAKWREAWGLIDATHNGASRAGVSPRNHPY